MVDLAMRKDADISLPGALALADQAVHLLRRKGGPALACYYIGSLPFLLGLLYFWSDMSRSPDAGWYCAPAAAGVAALFVWMKFWQARFCRSLWCALQGSEPEPWPWLSAISLAARQTLLQATGLVIIPLAALIMLPTAWSYAFYQNLSVMDWPGPKSLRTLYGNAARQALFWPGQNHLFLLLASGFALIVCVNVAAGLMLLPYLLKWLLGIETAFTISGLHAVTNTTFLALTGALTYACVDPIIKAAYTLRCFYGHSRRTGDDLRAGLKPFLVTVSLAAILCAWPLARASTGEPDKAVPPKPSVTAPNAGFTEQLDKAVDRVLTRHRFAWRLPRERSAEETPEEKSGWLWAALKWTADKIEAVFEAIDSWFDALSEWLQKYLPKGKGAPSDKSNWDAVIRIVFYGIGGGLLILLLLSAGKHLRARRISRRNSVTAPDPGAVDLNDETITAKDLPRERWIAMAREMAERGEYRQALRAYYLSILSQLGDHNRIAIARYKSNREYQLELGRRSHAEPELLDLFSRCVARFERAWYGMHSVAENQMSQFVSDQERITRLVQQSTTA